MSVSKTVQSLPFGAEGFGFEEFERFMRALLNQAEQISLKGVGHLDRSKFTVNYGKRGDSQKGIDIKGYISGGGVVALQCKHHENGKRAGKTQVEKAIKTANTKYKDAEKYVFITNTELTPAAIEAIDRHSKWSFLDGSKLHDLIRKLPERKAAYLIFDAFGELIAKQFFPFYNGRLVHIEDYLTSYEAARAHQHPFIGREEELDAITKQLTTEKGSVLVIKGKGGIGKSRLLLESLKRVSAEGDYEAFCYAHSGFGSKNLPEVDGKKGFVIGIDDADMTDHLDLIHEVSAKSGGRLLLTVSPEQEGRVRELLRPIWGERIVFFPRGEDSLPALNQPEVSEIIRGIIGYEHEAENTIIDRCEGVVTFAVVAAEMLKNGAKDFQEVVLSSHFRERVILHLRDTFLEKVPAEKRDEARRVLQILCLLSPLGERELKHAAEFLEIGRWEMEDYLKILTENGLMKACKEGREIVPELFTDMMAVSTLTSPENALFRTRFLESPISQHQGKGLLRSLAIAEEHRRTTRIHHRPLFTLAWETFHENFKQATSHERENMLAIWSDFGMRVGAETLDLVESAFSLPYKPVDPEENPFWPPEYDEIIRERVQNYSCNILQSLGQYNEGQLDDCLRLLLKYEQPSEAYVPLFSYYSKRKVKSFLKVLEWLELRITQDEIFPEMATEPNKAVSKILAGVFTSFRETSSFDYDVSYRQGAILIDFERTEQLREKAFSILEHLIEKGGWSMLNVVSFIAELVKKVSLPFGVRDISHLPEDWQKLLEKWESVRKKSLELLRKAVKKAETPYERYFVRKELKELAKRVKDAEPYYQTCLNALSEIEEDLDLRCMISVASRSDIEQDPESDNDYNAAYKKGHEDWVLRLQETSKELLETFPKLKDLLDKLNEIASALTPNEDHLNWGGLIHKLCEEDKTLISHFRAEVLKKPDCPFESVYENLCDQQAGDSDSRFDIFLSEGVLKERFRLLRSICSTLRCNFRKHYDFPNTINALARLYEEARGDWLKAILNYGNLNLFTQLENFFNQHLPWEHFDEEHLKVLGKRYDSYSPINPKVYSPEFWQGFFRALSKFPCLSTDVSHLIRMGCAMAPTDAFNYFQKMMQEEEFSFPYYLEGKLILGNHEEIPDYSQRVDEIYALYCKEKENTQSEKWLKIALTHNKDKAVEIARREMEMMPEEDMADFCYQWADNHIVFHFPELVEAILKKAQKYSRTCYESCLEELKWKAVNVGRSYTNGIQQNPNRQILGSSEPPKPQSWVLDLARDRREEHREVKVLFTLYSLIVEHEEQHFVDKKVEFEREEKERKKF